MSLGNAFVMAILASPLHHLLGSGMAVITVEGRKTGRDISTPINVTKEGDGFIATSLRTRNWWRNLRGGRPARLRLAGRQYRVRGEVIEKTEELTGRFGRYFERYPHRAKYFGVRLAADGKPVADDIRRVVSERVIVDFQPATQGDAITKLPT